jgi:predicted nucleotidyltransferase
MGTGGDPATALRPALTEFQGIVSAYLFGSAARGRLHRESDIDVGMLLDRGVYPTTADRFEARLRVSARLAAVVGRTVDIVILNDAPPTLSRHIMCDGVRLLVTDREQDRHHLRVTLSRAADLVPFLRRTRAVKLDAISR